MRVRQGFRPISLGANAVQPITGMHLGGFLPKTDGTITVTGRDSRGVNDETFLDAIPVTAGVLCEIPCSFPVPGFTVTLGGGASGTLFV